MIYRAMRDRMNQHLRFHHREAAEAGRSLVAFVSQQNSVTRSDSKQR
jgi:hypothetical protein